MGEGLRGRRGRVGMVVVMVVGRVVCGDSALPPALLLLLLLGGLVCLDLVRLEGEAEEQTAEVTHVGSEGAVVVVAVQRLCGGEGAKAFVGGPPPSQQLRPRAPSDTLRARVRHRWRRWAVLVLVLVVLLVRYLDESLGRLRLWRRMARHEHGGVRRGPTRGGDR